MSYVCEDKNNCNIYTLPVGVQNMMTTLVIYYKINYLATLYPNNFTPTYLCKKKIIITAVLFIVAKIWKQPIKGELGTSCGISVPWTTIQ